MTGVTLPNPESSTPAPPPLAGVAVAALVAIAIAGWITLGSAFLAPTSLFGGFMVFWYWAKVEHLRPARLPATVLGALVGIGLSWLMLYLATNHGGAGFALGLLLLFVAIYLDIVEVMPLFFNASAMLFSIVAAAPLFQLKINWIEFCAAALGGGAFFGAFVTGVTWLASRKQTVRPAGKDRG